MKQVGYVRAIAEGLADIALGEHIECSKCGACLATMGKRRRELKAVNNIGAGVGDKVEVETAPGFTVAAAFLLYIAPIVAGSLGGLIGYRLSPALGLGQRTGALLLAGALLGGCILMLVTLERAYFSRHMPYVVRVIGSGSQKKEV